MDSILCRPLPPAKISKALVYSIHFCCHPSKVCPLIALLAIFFSHHASLGFLCQLICILEALVAQDVTSDPNKYLSQPLIDLLYCISAIFRLGITFKEIFLLFICSAYTLSTYLRNIRLCYCIGYPALSCILCATGMLFFSLVFTPILTSSSIFKESIYLYLISDPLSNVRDSDGCVFCLAADLALDFKCSDALQSNKIAAFNTFMYTILISGKNSL